MVDDWGMKGRTPVEYRRIRNFIQEIQTLILRDSRPLKADFALSAEPLPLSLTLDLPRNPIGEGEVWGRTWESGYFRLRGTVPLEWAGRAVAAWLDFGGEGLIYSRDGQPLCGIANGSAFDENYSKDVFRLMPECRGGESVELFVEAAANRLFGVDEASPPARKTDPARHGSYEARTRRMRIALFDEQVWQLWLDMKVLLDLWERLDAESVRAVRMLKALLAVSHLFREDPARAVECRAVLAAQLSLPAQGSALSTTVVGHAHIDTAWLWRLGETRRKAARTFANQLDLIGRYPGYIFGASAPLHHVWMKESYPGLYDRIKEAVAKGRWEPQGGMWVEADCNLTSGESLIRQFIHGKNFWKDEFGVDVRNCWIPDVFGYSGALPQIMKKCGVDFFMTQKLSWSKFNDFPHDTFRWRGIDGTEILTHFPPEQTYNSTGLPSALRMAEKKFQEKAFLDEFITLLGIGDGGGGPKEEHLEHILRARDTEGLPKARFGRADDLFRRLALHSPELDVWVGELYLEYHRGTLTTQANAKRNNRRLEGEIRAVEALWSALPLADYPRESLDAIVKVLLLHQFHDILPGSSIHAVYEEAERAYAAAFEELDRLTRQAGDRLLAKEDGAWTLFNPLPFAWVGTCILPASFEGKSPGDGAGRLLPAQREGTGVRVRVSVPSEGFLTVRPVPHTVPDPFGPSGLHGPSGPFGPASGEAPAATAMDPLVLENELVLYRFDSDARLVEAWDRQAGRPILKAGEKGNILSFYQDTPHNFDAWDIDYYYVDQLLETARGVSATFLGAGPVGQAMRFVLTVGKSRIVQTIRLEAGSKLLSFETEVAWNESRRLLRTSFPLNSVAVDAVCEIACGHLRRPTHSNTEWDFAKFEVCAHRWIDIGDARYGVALLNDCKYGHSVRDNVLGLSLLRSPLYPDPDADQGNHRFTYALLPHEGSLEASDVIERAAALNRVPVGFPDRAVMIAAEACRRVDREDGIPTPSDRSHDQWDRLFLPFRVTGSGLSLEALKKAEKEEAWIVRVSENRGLGTEGTISGPWTDATICETDMLEWNDGEVRAFDSEHRFRLLPFEIRTFKIRPALPSQV